MLRYFSKLQKNTAQTAVEYFILTTLIAIIIFVGFRRWATEVNTSSTEYFEEVSEGIMGSPVGTLDGGDDSALGSGPGPIIPSP